MGERKGSMYLGGGEGIGRILLGPNEGGTRSCDGCKLDFEQDFIEEGKINVADEQEAPKNPNEKMGVFNNSLPSHALVSIPFDY